ncbi:MAG: 4Fe-4S dicluster domain-containing protein [Pseudomonadota bacterium]
MSKRYGIVINLEKCIGCHACTIACKMQNGTELDIDWTRVKTVGDPKAKIGQDIPRGSFPHLSLSWLPILCMHCSDPPCVRRCPSRALTQRDDGIVVFDKQTCIGCQACGWVCPYDIPRYSSADGTVEKCHLCFSRIDRGKEPFCVTACVYGARIFGDLNNPESAVSKLIARKQGRQHLPEYGTNPTIRYVGP